jgi:hypothetical protein
MGVKWCALGVNWCELVTNLFRLAGWDRLLIGELCDLLRTISKKFAMAVLCQCISYEDLRHQLLSRVDSLQPLVAELTVLVKSGGDDLAMACAALIAMCADDASRRQLLHVPQTHPLLASLINQVRPSPNCPAIPASVTAPVMSCLYAFSEDLFSQVRLLSIHPDPEALPESILAVLNPPPWWWAPMWTDDLEVKAAARTDAAQVLNVP